MNYDESYVNPRKTAGPKCQQMDDIRALKSRSPEVRSLARRKLMIRADRNLKIAKRQLAKGNEAAAAYIMDEVKDLLDVIGGRTRASKGRKDDNTRIADQIIAAERRVEMLKFQD